MKNIGIALVAIAACASSPPTRKEEANLAMRAGATLGEMRAKDPGIDDFLDNAYAYAVFPDIGKAGIGVGGAYGKGILYERGRVVGNVTLSQASFGAQLGGQTYGELVVLRTKADADRLKSGRFEFGANASAVAVKAGAAAATDFRNGTAVFVMPRGGLMVEASLSGQRIDYTPPAG